MSRPVRWTWGVRRAGGFVLAAVALAGCGPKVVSTQTYAESFPDAEEKPLAVWMALTPGEEVVVAAGTRPCAEKTGESFDALESAPLPLSGQPWAAKASAWKIVESQIRTSDAATPGYLALRLANGQSEHWVRLDGGAALNCLQPASDSLLAAMRREGQMVVFTPWKAGCHAIEAGGQAPRSVLLEAEAGATLQIGDVIFAGNSAADESTGGATWLQLNNATVRVRADAIESCFSPADGSGGSIEPPTDASVLLHTDPERCTESEEGGKRHFDCSSTVGVWEGEARDRVVSLALVRRTLGPLHFLDGRPVAGTRWAKAVVSVRTGARTDRRVGELYDVMERTVAEALSGEDGLVRMAQADDDPSVTYRVAVEVGDVRIGPLEKHVTDETSQYQDGTRTEPHPEKAAARAAVGAAEQRASEAESSYQTEVQALEVARELCITGCNEADDQIFAGVCTAGCGVVQVSHDGVDQANNALAQARAHDASTPETHEVPIMKTWAYKKQHFGRSTSATLKVTMEPTGGQAEAVTIPLATQWTDYQVEADPAHDVAGHTPDRGPIDNPEALVAFIAEQANAKLAERLRAAISRATLQEAMKALAASGAPTKQGYEEVDAMAFSLVGNRLRQAVQRGRATVPANFTPYALPVQAVSLGPTDCVVAVAVAGHESGTTITIVGNGGRHGDLRNKSFAAVEVCASELANGQVVLDDLGIQSTSGAQARWGLYRSHDGRSAAAATKSQAEPPPQSPARATTPAAPTAASVAAPSQKPPPAAPTASTAAPRSQTPPPPRPVAPTASRATPRSQTPPPPPAPPATTSPSRRAGCAKDTDCKGDRICDRGACVSPP